MGELDTRLLVPRVQKVLHEHPLIKSCFERHPQRRFTVCLEDHGGTIIRVEPDTLWGDGCEREKV